MFEWFSDASTRASRSKRARRSATCESPAGSTLMATSRPSLVSRAFHTSPMPPLPIGSGQAVGTDEATRGQRHRENSTPRGAIMPVMAPLFHTRGALIASALVACLITVSPSAQQSLPSGPLVIRAFTLRFDPAGTFTLSGDGWPSMAGTWTHERPRSDASTTERARGLHRRRTLHLLSGRRARQLHADRGRLHTPADDSRSQRVVTARRSTGGRAAPHRTPRRHRETRTAAAGERHRPLAIVPRARSGRQRRWTTAA